MPNPSTRAPRVPDKPTLDNFGGALGRRLGGSGDLPLRRHRHAGRGVLHRHAASHGVRLPPYGIGLRLRPDRRHRPLPPHAGMEALLPDGLGRQRAPDGAAGADLLRGHLRPFTSLRPGLHPARGTGKGGPPRQPAELHSALPPAHRRGRAGLRGPVATGRVVGRLGAHLRHYRRQKPAHQPAHVSAQPGPGRGLHLRGTDPVGRGLPDGGGPGRDGGPRVGRRLPPPALRRHRDRDDAPRTGGRLCGPGRPPRRRALRGPLRLDSAHAALRGRGAGPGPPPGGAGQGIGHRHDLHLRRRDRRRVVARARPADTEHRDALGPHHRDASAGGARRRSHGGPSPAAA